MHICCLLCGAGPADRSMYQHVTVDDGVVYTVILCSCCQSWWLRAPDDAHGRFKALRRLAPSFETDVDGLSPETCFRRWTTNRECVECGLAPAWNMTPAQVAAGKQRYLEYLAEFRGHSPARGDAGDGRGLTILVDQDPE